MVIDSNDLLKDLISCNTQNEIDTYFEKINSKYEVSNDQIKIILGKVIVISKKFDLVYDFICKHNLFKKTKLKSYLSYELTKMALFNSSVDMFFNSVYAKDINLSFHWINKKLKDINLTFDNKSKSLVFSSLINRVSIKDVFEQKKINMLNENIDFLGLTMKNMEDIVLENLKPKNMRNIPLWVLFLSKNKQICLKEGFVLNCLKIEMTEYCGIYKDYYYKPKKNNNNEILDLLIATFKETKTFSHIMLKQKSFSKALVNALSISKENAENIEEYSSLKEMINYKKLDGALAVKTKTKKVSI